MDPPDPSDCETAPASVFFSYARADEARVQPIIAGLQARGFDVWWDGRLQSGARFAREIETALETADAVVVAWSRASVESDWVCDEAAHGRDRHRLAPILLDAVEPPLGFRQYQTVDFSGSRGGAAAALDRLADGIRELAGRPHAPGPSLPASLGLSRRTLMLAGGGAAGVVALGAGGLWLARSLGGPSLDDRCVAVAPFTNLSDDPKQTYFSEGLSEDIRTRLAGNPALKVLGEITCRKFGVANADGQKLARALGVGLILSGSVRKREDALRIAAELTEVSTGVTRWARSFDRPLTDVFAVQSEIAAAVDAALAEHMASPPKAPPAPAQGTLNVEAYEALLRGQGLDRLDQNEITERQALAEFDRAVSLDPSYAAAHAARARALSAIAFSFAKAPDVGGLFKQAVAAAEKAIALAPSLADAQSTLGGVMFYGRLDARAARAPFERAYALGRTDPATLSRFAAFAAKTGRTGEADAAIGRALELDPLNPLIHRNAGLVRLAERRFADGLPPLKRSLELNPKMGSSHAQAALALHGLGRFAEAAMEAALEPVAMFRLAVLAIVRKKLSDEPGARAALDKLVREVGDAALYQQAQVLAQWGETERALAALNRARAGSDAGLTSAKVDFLLDPVRSTAGFKRLLEGMGLA